MKVFVVIFAVFAVALAQRDQFRQECIAELNIQPENLENFKKGVYDGTAPCFTECVFKKMGVFTDGNFDIPALSQILRSDTKTPDELKADIDGCIDNDETDSCQRSYKAFKCFKENGLYKVPKRS